EILDARADDPRGLRARTPRRSAAAGPADGRLCGGLRASRSEGGVDRGRCHRRPVAVPLPAAGRRRNPRGHLIMGWPNVRDDEATTRSARLRVHAALLAWATILLVAASLAV